MGGPYRREQDRIEKLGIVVFEWMEATLRRSPWEPALSQVCTVRRIVRADGNPVSGRPVLSDIPDLADLAAARGAATSLRYCLFFLLPLARYSGVFYQLL